MTDLTQITTPFGLLDGATKDKLSNAWEHGAQVEVFDGTDWVSTDFPNWLPQAVYRANPKPATRTLHREFGIHGRHTITCSADGTNPTVIWEPDYK